MIQLHGRFMPGLLGARLWRVTDNPTAWARGQVRFLGSLSNLVDTSDRTVYRAGRVLVLRKGYETHFSGQS
jgi:hypothetical protein